MFYDLVTILIYVSIGIAFFTIFILTLFMFYTVDEIKEKIKQFYFKMKFNGIIRIITIGYLKQSFSFSTVLIYSKSLNWKNIK